MRVLVTGAGGQTGSIVLRKLLERGTSIFTARAMVRSEESGKKLRETMGDLSQNLEVVLGDVSKSNTIPAAFQGVDALIVVTSAMPRLLKSSLVGVILSKIFTLGFSSRKPSFYFDDGQSPENVDWLGQKAQIDAAKAAGVKHVVLVSSMAGTKPDHFLNTQMDNIVLWKRKAECYLIASGVPYTIIHPGGLLPHFGSSTPAPGGRRQLVAGLDDLLLDAPTSGRLIPREDVAEVCVECLLSPGVSFGRSFDLVSNPETEEVRKLDLRALLEPLEGKNCRYTSADEAFQGNQSNDKDRGCCAN